MLPDPLNRYFDEQGRGPLRILSDRGICKALEEKLILITPSFDAKTETKRIQPATLDVCIQEVEESWPLGREFEIDEHYNTEENILKGRCVSTIALTELIDFGQLRFQEVNYLGVMAEARSSVRRLGGFMANSGSYFFSNPTNSTLEIGNFSGNDICFARGERIAQLFFTVKPFADKDALQTGGTVSDREKEHGELVRSLEMGVEVVTNAALRKLQKEGYMTISPRLVCRKGLITLHASSTAYRMKKLKDGIDFSKRDAYTREELLEPIDINNGYLVKPHEHVIVETVEKLELSSHVGILCKDNLFQNIFWNTGGMYLPQERKERFVTNMEMLSLIDGWVDPGYSGNFSRQPKWLSGRVIRPGDVIGYGQAFFFPKGVGTSYGSSVLGSQYQEQKKTVFSG